MLRRLALVIWWFGALIAVLWLVAAIGMAVLTNEVTDRWVMVGGFLVAAVASATIAWSISFVIGGSFWRPPRLTAT
jgi:hypothetical protein